MLSRTALALAWRGFSSPPSLDCVPCCWWLSERNMGKQKTWYLAKSLIDNQPRSAHTHLPSTGDELMLEPDSIPQFTHAVLPLPTMYQAFSNTLSLRQIKRPELPASEFAAALRIELRKHDCTQLEQRRPKSK